jgi:hypothetical protein
MKIIENYNQLPVSNLQLVRLYLQGRPLLSLWSKKRRGKNYREPKFVNLINQELNDDHYIAVDCAGWYFDNLHRQCTAIEILHQGSNYWHNIHYEYDYLVWHPTYLAPVPVLAYYSTYFKYSKLDDFLTFCQIWSMHHPKLIIGLDPTKIKFNYLRHNLIDIVTEYLPNCKIRCLIQQNFDLLFVIEK